MSDTQTKLREAVRALFDEGRIDTFIGYERGTLRYRSRPSFVSSAAGADELVWDATCANNLAVYLPSFFEPKRGGGEPPRIGIAAKGCDMRAVLGLVKERQIPRANVIIVGVPCQGLADTKKLAASAELQSSGEADGKSLIDGSGPVEERFLDEACLECRSAEPVGADLLIDGKSRKSATPSFDRVTDFEAKSPEERWRYFESEVSKCLRCYACRQACPNCYCKVCFVEQTKPRWVDPGLHLSDLMLFHIGRAFHQAGRCIGCNACVRACPMGIDLQTFAQKLVKDVEELFDYKAGLDPEERPPLCTFRQDDGDSFITEP